MLVLFLREYVMGELLRGGANCKNVVPSSVKKSTMVHSKVAIGHIRIEGEKDMKLNVNDYWRSYRKPVPQDKAQEHLTKLYWIIQRLKEINTDVWAEFSSPERCLILIGQTNLSHLFPTMLCPRCNTTTTVRPVRNKPTFMCSRCIYQISPMVGTIFQRTHIPLNHWFRIILELMERPLERATTISHDTKIPYKQTKRMCLALRHRLMDIRASKPDSWYQQLKEEKWINDILHPTHK